MVAHVAGGLARNLQVFQHLPSVDRPLVHVLLQRRLDHLRHAVAHGPESVLLAGDVPEVGGRDVVDDGLSDLRPVGHFVPERLLARKHLVHCHPGCPDVDPRTQILVRLSGVNLRAHVVRGPNPAEVVLHSSSLPARPDLVGGRHESTPLPRWPAFQIGKWRVCLQHWQSGEDACSIGKDSRPRGWLRPSTCRL